MQTCRFWIFAPLLLFVACNDSNDGPGQPALVEAGRQVFRYDTFGDERQWTDSLRMHEVVETLSPATALALGIKVDSDLVPSDVLANADFDDPATTVALVEMGAVVGLVGQVEAGRISRLGVTCALCHSTVDDSVAPGIGRRLDGWANTDLNVGAILATSPALQAPDIQSALGSWGPGKYDARFNQDGINDPAVIPPAYGLSPDHPASFTGDGDIEYWNAYVAVTQMGAQASFRDDRIGIDVQFSPDLLAGKLDVLRLFQHSLSVPPAATTSFDPDAAARGRTLFDGKAQCALCHTGPNFSTGAILPATAVGTDPLHAQRSATGGYRITPLRALWQHAPYFHDGSAATLQDVVDHYDQHFELGLLAPEKSDLVEFLKSI